MYTTIKARVIDQAMQVTSVPTLASGGDNVIRLEVTFDSLWNGFGKTAIFYREANQVYHVVMRSDACIVPREVMTEAGKLYMGILGVSGSTTRTTEVVVLNVSQGAITGLSPLKPLPDVYRQMLSAYAEATREIAVERARIDNLTTLTEGSTTGDAELADIRIGYDGTTYDNAGAAVREQASVAYALQTDTPVSYITGSITNGVEEPNATRARFEHRVKACKAVVTIQAHAGYYFGYAVYDEAGVYDGVDHGWNAMANNRLTFDAGYFSFNFRRADNATITDADLEAISTCVTVKQINVFSAIEDAERHAVEGVPFAQQYSLEVGTLAEGSSVDHANRCRFVEKVAITEKTTASFKSLAEYMFGYAVYDEAGAYDGVDRGWNALYGASTIQFSAPGYVRFNFRRIDDTAITETDLAALADAVTVATAVNTLDVMADTKKRIAALEQDKKDAIASVNLEHGRVNGASYVFMRIPKVTNTGKTLRPTLRLTSADESLEGGKTSALTYAREHGAVVTINAGLFNTTSLQPVGQTIIDGVSYTNTPMTDDMGSPISAAECYPLCIDSNGDLSAPYTRDVDTAVMIADGVVHAVTGWGKVVEDFAPCADTVENEIVHAGTYIRQVIGQFQNGDYCICTVDMSRGNVENEAGLTYTDLAQLLVSKGVKFAYSLDGGGSAETVLGVRQMNPIYEGSAGRAVPTVICFNLE